MRFSPKKGTSKQSCCVAGCNSFSRRDPTLRFHLLPKENSGNIYIKNIFGVEEAIDRRTAWIKVLKLKNPGNRSLVCSLHFKEEDYILPEFSSSKRYQHKNAVPSLNLPATDKEKEDALKKDKSNFEREERRKRRSLNKKVNTQSEVVAIAKNESDIVSQIDTSDTDIVNNNAEQLIENLDIVNNNAQQLEENPVISTLFIDKSVQVKFEIYSNFIKTTEDLITATGLSSFEMLNFLEEIVKVVNPQISASSKKQNSRLSVKDKIVLTFIKMKQNVSYAMLKVLFQECSEQNCRQIFLRMIKVLHNGLRFAVQWPSKEEVLKNIPICFNEFTEVRAVIDVIEMSIETPKCKCCQIATYSTYKSAHTIRFMTAVSPGGLITFISDPFLGRSSDKAIFEKSKFIELFDEGDGLMTDRGFLIDDLCLKHKVKLVRPPFMTNKKQFSKEEALANVKIARARVHIERSNQRIKVFKILSTKIPSFLVSKINQIFFIACAIVNLSSPILSDNKFNK